MSAQFAAHRAQLNSIQLSAPKDKTFLLRSNEIFKKVTSSETRKYTLFAANALATKGPNDELNILTFLKPGQGEVWCASLGASLQSCNVVCTNPTKVGNAFVSVVPLALAETCEVPFLSQEQHSPGNTNAPNSDNPPDDIGVEDVTAVFAIIPMAMAILRDFGPPKDWDFNQPVSDEFIKEFPHQALWMLGQQWLYKHNDSKSLHSFSKMFKIIDKDLFQVEGIELQEESWLTLSTPGATSTLRAKYTEEFNEQVINMTRLTMPLTADAIPPSTSASGIDYFALSKGVAEATIAAKTSQEDSTGIKNENKIFAKCFYRIFFGSVKKLVHLDGTECLQFVPAELTSRAENVINTSSNSDASLYFSREFEQMKTTFNQSDTHHSTYNWDHESLQSVGIQAIRHADFTTKNLQIFPTYATKYLSVLNFLPPAGSTDMEEWKESCHTAVRQERMGEDSSNRNKRKTHFKHDGKCVDFHDICALVANVAAFAQFFVKNYSRESLPTVVLLFDKVSQSLRNSETRHWVQHGPDTTSVPTAILAQMSLIVQAIVGQAASTGHHGQLQKNQLTDPTLFSESEVMFRRLQNDITKAVRLMSIGDFPTKPSFSDLIVTAKPKATPVSSKANKRPEMDRNSSYEAANKKRKSADRRSEPVDRRSEQGLLIWSGFGPPKMPNFSWEQAGTGRKVPFCKPFLLRGQACNRINCNYFHLTRTSLVNQGADRKKMFCTYVDDTDGMNFAPGQEVTLG